jgi:hypothetical protein
VKALLTIRDGFILKCFEHFDRKPERNCSFLRRHQDGFIAPSKYAVLQLCCYACEQFEGHLPAQGRTDMSRIHEELADAVICLVARHPGIHELDIFERLSAQRHDNGWKQGIEATWRLVELGLLVAVEVELP